MCVRNVELVDRLVGRLFGRPPGKEDGTDRSGSWSGTAGAGSLVCRKMVVVIEVGKVCRGNGG